MSRTVVILTLMSALGLTACDRNSPGGSPNDNNNNEPSIAAECGNGVLELSEECDDGPGNSDIAPDACRTSCRRAACNDGVQDRAEDCDDGAHNSDLLPDACRRSCQLPGCGDTVIDAGGGESCDDGNLVSGDGCSAQCRVEYCGNGILDTGEVCDDGNNLSGDGCSSDCHSDEVCGNGIIDVGNAERCDCGVDATSLARSGCADINGTAAAGCNPSCHLTYCGNGVLDPGEICDDGDQTTLGDGCSPDCRSEEQCGNGYTDVAVGETCDCGTQLANKPAFCAALNGEPGSHCTAGCISLSCGDSAVDTALGEVCDDGNQDNLDGCAADCRSDETCPNGVADFLRGETCDDGNVTAGDGCSPNCQVEYCGNAELDPGEVCDDGNQLDGDGCSSNCRSLEVCGNAVLDGAASPAEECDDGNQVGGDGCSASCQVEYCGNGELDLLAGEVCDDGSQVSGDGCSADCRSDERCGNGVVDPHLGEVCDDGNLVDNDGCSSFCGLDTCGDGQLDASEICDDGNRVDGDGCNARCSSTEVCGNAITDQAVGEECDDGNFVETDACHNNCQWPGCGDGYRGLGETCDDGNLTPGDGCSASCQLEYCGNAVLDPAEVCDDGNMNDGDGCAADCLSDERCGNGLVDVAAALPEQCDDGSTVAGDGCSASCQLEYCGNAVLDPGEDCDDGNTLDGDGCSAACQHEASGGSCGDGVVDVLDGELCEPGLPAVTDCQSLGFYYGTVGCDASCLLDLGTCLGRCGDGVRDATAGENCDGFDVGPQTCSSLGYTYGSLICDASCQQVLTTECRNQICGNAIQEGSEVCDGWDIGNTSCQQLGSYIGGRVGCAADCSAFLADDCVPTGWRCDQQQFGTGDGCHCGCGLVDPDCADASSLSCDFCNALGSCSASDCASNIEALDNASCTAPAFGQTSYYTGWTYDPGLFDGDCDDITLTGTDAALSDDDMRSVSLGFVYRWSSGSTTGVELHANGYLVIFGSLAALPAQNTCLPFPGPPFSFIAAWWDDLDPTQGGTVLYETLGVAPYRRFVAQYDVPHKNGSGSNLLFRVVLYETTNAARVCYEQTNVGDPLYDHGASATVGIQHGVANPMHYSCDASVIHDGLVLEYTKLP